jgi:DNA polymerase-3 subunit chi
VTRIDFYHYAARAYERASRLVVYSSDAPALERFDKSLWTYQATKFVPHCRAGGALAAETPVILAASGDDLPHHDVLLNLDDEWPPFFASFERLLEIVATAEEDKAKARARYAFYKKRGYEIQVNAIEGERRKGE